MVKLNYGRFVRRSSVSIPVLAMAISLPAVGYTQTTETAEASIGRAPIVVTASRREASLQDTPLSVTSISPEDLTQSGESTLREIIEYAPGVNFTGGASPVANTITMRGVAQAGRASTVGIYLDDVPLGSSNSFAAGPGIQFDGVQGDLERIELIRGPQGTLYGSSAMGGVVRYITRDPSRSSFQARFQADLSTTEEGGFNQNYSGRLGIPIADQRLGLSVAGYYEDFGGFIDRIAASPTGAAEDVDAFERYGIFTKLVARPIDDVTARFMIIHTNVESTGANSVALQGPPFTLANGPFSTDEGLNDLNDDFTLYAGTFEFDLGFGTLISSTSYQERENSNSADLVATFGTLLDLFNGDPAGTTTSAPFTGLIRTERFVQEVRLTSNENDSFEWSIGGIYSDEDSSNIQTLLGQPSNFLLLDVDLGSELVEYAGFGNFRYFLSPDFDIGVGVRLSHVSSAVALIDGPGLLVANVPETTSTDTVDTYSFTARFRPSPQLSLYARVASGYRPENANLPLLDALGNNAAPALIESDTLWSYEIGAKGNLLEGMLYYDVAVWYIDWSNLQAVTFVNGATTGGNANSDVTAYGFEAAVAAQLSSRFSIDSTLSYAHSTLDDDETSAFGALAGENLQLLPRWTASIRANYDFPISDTVEGFFSGGARYVGSRDTGFDGGTGSNGAVITPLIANFSLEDYVVANLSAGIRTGPVTVSAYVNNLFDEYAFTGGSARPIVGGVRATANVLRPRTFGLVLTLDY